MSKYGGYWPGVKLHLEKGQLRVVYMYFIRYLLYSKKLQGTSMVIHHHRPHYIHQRTKYKQTNKRKAGNL